MRDQTIGSKVLQIFLHDNGADPVSWIQPGGRPDHDVDPFTALLPLAIAFLARSRVVVLSFAIGAVLERSGKRGEVMEEARRRRREERSEWGAQYHASAAVPFMASLPSD